MKAHRQQQRTLVHKGVVNMHYTRRNVERTEYDARKHIHIVRARQMVVGMADGGWNGVQGQHASEGTCKGQGCMQSLRDRSDETKDARHHDIRIRLRYRKSIGNEYDILLQKCSTEYYIFPESDSYLNIRVQSDRNNSEILCPSVQLACHEGEGYECITNVREIGCYDLHTEDSDDQRGYRQNLFRFRYGHVKNIRDLSEYGYDTAACGYDMSGRNVSDRGCEFHSWRNRQDDGMENLNIGWNMTSGNMHMRCCQEDGAMHDDVRPSRCRHRDAEQCEAINEAEVKVSGIVGLLELRGGGKPGRVEGIRGPPGAGVARWLDDSDYEAEELAELAEAEARRMGGRQTRQPGNGPRIISLYDALGLSEERDECVAHARWLDEHVQHDVREVEIRQRVIYGERSGIKTRVCTVCAQDRQDDERLWEACECGLVRCKECRLMKCPRCEREPSGTADVDATEEGEASCYECGPQIPEVRRRGTANGATPWGPA